MVDAPEISEVFALCPEFQIRGAGFPSHWPGQLASDHERPWSERYGQEVETVRSLFENERLQEALWWQNPAFARNTLPALLSGDCFVESSKSRRRLRKFVSYLQRYCAKNEVIGFFGPVGFGRLVNDLLAPRESGGEWIQQRRVYLEPWIVRVIWYHFTTAQPEHALLYLSPRLSLRDGVVFDGSKSRRADGGRAVTEEMEKLLRQLRKAPLSLWDLTAEGYGEATLDLARRGGWISALPAIPSTGFPLEWAKHQARLYHPSICEPIQDELARFESLLSRMEEPRSGLESLPELIQEFQSLVAAKNSGQASRNQGAFYGGRLGFYEDCQRRGLELPKSWVTDIVPALSLVLQSARWMALQTAETAEQLFDLRAEKLYRRFGEGYPAVHLWESTRDLFADPTKLKFKETGAELARRWRKVLGEGAFRRWDSADVAADVERLFPSRPHTYKGAQFHSCDLFFTAHGKAVLGEVHPCLFPFQDLSTTLQNPNPEFLNSWYEERSDRVQVRPATFVPFTRLHLDGRADQETHAVLVDPHHGSWRPSSQCVRLGDMTVHRLEDRFVLRGPDGLEVGLLDFFTPDLSELQNLHFSPFAEAGPDRLEIDGLVVRRAEWTLRASEFSLSGSLSVSQRLTRLNEALVEKGLPEQFFARFAKEVKPLLIVRDSVLFLDLFWSLLTASGECRCSEVLPALEQAWLPTPDGAATGEGRFVFFDRLYRRA